MSPHKELTPSEADLLERILHVKAQKIPGQPYRITPEGQDPNVVVYGTDPETRKPFMEADPLVIGTLEYLIRLLQTGGPSLPFDVKAFSSVPLKDVFSGRTLGTLNGLNFRTAGDVMKYINEKGEKSLLHLPGVGKKTKDQIMKVLNSLGSLD